MLTFVVGLWSASSALAAFPGSNGLLAVQPVSGGGIVLVSASGRGEQRICQGVSSCGTPVRPRWSPDGQKLVFAGPEMRIVYADGSCLNCQFGAAKNPAFRPGGTAISFIDNGRVMLDGLDGVRDSAHGLGVASDAVWSAAGWLAAVRGGAIWAGLPGRLARIGVGSEPSWSPDGTMLAAQQGGWIVTIGLRGHEDRRLVHGSAPAFSPDGRWIAYVAPDHRLMIVRASGAPVAPRAVGNIEGVSVDWQPIPPRSRPACVTPPGSTVLASSPTAVVTGPRVPLSPPDSTVFVPISYWGCLRADGRERLLESFDHNDDDGASFVGSVVLAGSYAGLAVDSIDEHYGGEGSTLQIFDLGTGLLQPKLGGESVECPTQMSPGPECGLEEVVLRSDGVSAADAYDGDPVQSSPQLLHVSCAPASSTCIAADPLQVLSTTNPAGGEPAWAGATIAQRPLSDVDCVSTSLCVGSSTVGCAFVSSCVSGIYTTTVIYTTTDPTGGEPAWTSVPLAGPPAYIEDLSCPATNLCVAIRGDGSVATSTDPTGGTTAWSISQVRSGDYWQAIFCSTGPQCFISNDSPGSVFISSNPSGGPSAWSPSTSIQPFDAGTCPTVNFCAAVGPDEIQTSTDPGAGIWTQHDATADLNGIACPSATLCLAVGADGALYESTDPSSGAWTQTTIDAGRNLNSISCPSASLCIAADSTGYVVTSTDPTGGPSAWIPQLVDGDPCTNTTPCSVEQIQASDADGLHTFDSSEAPGTGPFLTSLSLTGGVLSWNHDGMQHSDTLTP